MKCFSLLLLAASAAAFAPLSPQRPAVARRSVSALRAPAAPKMELETQDMWWGDKDYPPSRVLGIGQNIPSQLLGVSSGFALAIGLYCELPAARTRPASHESCPRLTLIPSSLPCTVPTAFTRSFHGSHSESPCTSLPPSPFIQARPTTARSRCSRCAIPPSPTQALLRATSSTSCLAALSTASTSLAPSSSRTPGACTSPPGSRSRTASRRGHR